MIQEPAPVWPDPETIEDDYVIPYRTLVKLGRGDAAAGRRLLRVLVDVEVVHEPVSGPVQKPESVRLATEDDEPALVELAKLDHEESACSVADFDEQHVRSFIYAATRDRDATIGVIDGPSGPIGMVYLVPECWWFHQSWYIAERLLFVHPDHRRSRHNRDLLRFAQSFVDDMSKQLGYTVFLISSVVGTRDVDRKAAIFGRMMQRAGGVYVYPSPPLSR